MARSCEVCGKGSLNGNKVSHAHNVSKRLWRPNLRSVRALVNGHAVRMYVCSRCLRSGKIAKAAH